MSKSKATRERESEILCVGGVEVSEFRALQSRVVRHVGLVRPPPPAKPRESRATMPKVFDSLSIQ